MPSRPKSSSPAASSTEQKITINLGCIELGKIDLLVKDGFYANRTELIRDAIRELLRGHDETVRAVTRREALVLGVHHFSAQQLQKCRDDGETLQIRVLGLASIALDVTPELALDTIDAIFVLGVLHASPQVRAALAGRIR